MCTNLMLSVPQTPGQSDPSIYVSARCLEMPGIIEQALYVMPKGQGFPLPAPNAPSPPPFDVPDPLAWTSAYDFVGIASSDNWLSLPNFNDGLNECGLGVGALWLQPGTTYPTTLQPGTQGVSFLDFPAWILGTCQTVGDVQAAIAGDSATITVIGPADLPHTDFVPLHYVVTDATGASIIVEFVNGETNVYDSANAVMTNAPTYDWQSTNVGNYTNLQLVGGATSTTGDATVGGQLLGLPGDSLPASRFIRAWFLSQGFAELENAGTPWLPAPAPLKAGQPEGFSGPEQTAAVVAMQLVQICMGTPYGMLLEQPPPPATGDPLPPPTYGDYTMWTSVRDHTNLKYYWVGAFSGVLNSVAFSEIDFSANAGYPGAFNFQILPQPTDFPWAIDVSNQIPQMPDDG